SEFGLVPDKDFDTAFSGSHDNSILGVINKDYESAAIANSVSSRMLARGVINEGDFDVLYTSQTFPTTSYGHVYNLHPELVEKIQDAFFSYDWEDSALQAEFANSGESQFIPITFNEHWAVIRTIDEANGVTYDCN
ncbi:MAG: PhnD/SsuA/transferrin family substrate-binding protein, partial [Pseudomonadota bacterium]